MLISWDSLIKLKYFLRCFTPFIDPSIKILAIGTIMNQQFYSFLFHRNDINMAQNLLLIP